MLIECAQCDAKVDGRVLAEKEYGPSEDGYPYKMVFLECPACHSCLVGHSELTQVSDNEWDFDKPSRVWPQPNTTFHFSIPRLTRQSLAEAKKCFSAQAYSACAVMCGRAIEAICAEHKTKSKNLGAGLKELRDKKVIDQRLFDWGEALREQRNIGAHANEQDIAREDARDVLDFAVAICEYVFVLSEKYEEFKKRQAQKASPKRLPSRPPPRPTPPPPTPPAAPVQT